jgi:endonuclease/exonuclease/phosphatase (EEP) superfamily protein YafD
VTVETNTIITPQTQKRKRHRQWSGAALGVLAGLFGLFMARLGHLWVGFDVFSQFSLQAVFLTLAMAAGLALPRFKSLAGVVFFVVAVVGYSLWPQIAASNVEGPTPAGHKRLKVAHFNTLITNSNLDAIQTTILAMDADVMDFVEITEDKLVVFAALRAKYPYQMDCFDIVNCDAVIISKFPLSDRIAKGSWLGAPFISASLGEEFGNVRVFGFHTTRFPHSRAQFTQIRESVKFIETLASQIVVMGDFNATPFSRMTELVSRGLNLRRLTNLPTWPATHSLPQLAIDHIFVSQNIKAINSEEIGDSAGSDHYPIMITLAVPQNNN